MMGRTHLLLGINAIWLLEAGTAPSPDRFVLAVAGAALGSLLADLDARASLLQTLRIGGVAPLVLPARLLNQVFGHRGALHSLFALGVLALLSLPLLGTLPLLWLGLALGYASHLVGDGCTRHGVPLFFPRRMRVHLLPKPLRLSTGSLAEDALFVLLALGCLALLLRHLLGMNGQPME